MKFITSKNELLPVLKSCGGFIPSRPSHPVLSNLLIVLKENSVSITASDLAAFLETKIDAQTILNGSFTVPHKLLFDIVSKTSPDEDIEISFDKDSSLITIQQNNSSFNIQGIDASEYPFIPELSNVQDITSFEISGNKLNKTIQSVLNAASKDDTKQVLTGINFQIDKNNLDIAATDGHRLHYAVEPNDQDNLEGLIELTIHSKFCGEIVKLLDTDGTVQISFDADLLKVTIGPNTLIIRRLSGAYPNYKGLIPTQFETELLCDRKALLAAVDKISVIQSKNSLITLDLTRESELIQLGSQCDGNLARSELVCQVIKGESDIKLGFNCKYLTEALKSIETTEVKFSCNAPNQPAIFTPMGDQSLTCLLMPVTIRE